MIFLLVSVENLKKMLMKLQEDFLHYVWRFKKFDFKELITTTGESINIFDFGQYNTNGGPDFLNAKIQIGDTIWAGNVEIHVRASEWHQHQHNENPAYNNVILHVVFEADESIHLPKGGVIPTLELHSRVALSLKNKYLKLLHEQDWIPCAKQIGEVPSFTKSSWMERLLIERLEQKTQVIQEMLERNNNDWEATFYQMMARNFGLKINVEPFERLAQSLPHIILAKHKDSLFQLEALLFGQAGFLNKSFEETYPSQLKKEYDFLKHKHSLTAIPHTMWQFLRLRPPSFPTIRIAQFAALTYQSLHLFSKILEAKDLKEITRLLKVELSDYWLTHYVFDKASPKRKKSLGTGTIQLIIINTIVPFLFLYGRMKGENSFPEKAFELLESLPPEKNSVIKKWQSLELPTENAHQTQSLLQLKKHYCDKKRCLQCNIGNYIMKG
jgi:hypothetical protein